MSRGHLSWESIVPEGYYSGKIIWGQFSWAGIVRGQLPRGYCPGGGGNCPSWELSRGKCLGVICPRCQLSEGQLSGGQLSREQLSWVQLSSGNCPVPLYSARIWLNLITLAE